MKRPGVLIVDDDKDIRETLQQCLELDGYVVEVATDGLDGLERLRVGPAPGLVLLDLMMPVMDGLQFLTAMDKDPVLVQIPVGVISAVSRRPSGSDGPQRLIRRFFEKPVELDALLDFVAQHCERGGG